MAMLVFLWIEHRFVLCWIGSGVAELGCVVIFWLVVCLSCSSFWSELISVIGVERNLHVEEHWTALGKIYLEEAGPIFSAAEAFLGTNSELYTVFPLNDPPPNTLFYWGITFRFMDLPPQFLKLFPYIVWKNLGASSFTTARFYFLG